MRAAVSGVAALTVATAVLIAGGVYHVHRRIADGLAPAAAGVVHAGLGPVPAAGGASVRVDFATMPDGPPPVRLGSQFFRTVEAGRSAAPAAVGHGRYTHGDPTGPDAASYLETTLGNPLHRLGATAVFADDRADIALVAWQTSLAGAQAEGRIPNAGIHFVASATQWHLSVWDATVRHEMVLASGSYTLSGRPGDPHSFEVSRDGATATVHLPDGAERTVSDPRIAAWTADDASWELYEYRPPEHPAALTAVWAE